MERQTAKTLGVITALACSLCTTYSATAKTTANADQANPTKWYTDVGFEYYSINLPTYRLPITFGNWVATVPPTLPPTGIDSGFNAANTTAGNTTTMPYIGIGYNIDYSARVLPSYFDQESIELRYSQFNRATKDLTNYSGATGQDAGAAYGVIWRINDVSVPTYGGGALRIVDSFIHASVHYHDADLFLKAKIKNLPTYLDSSAKVGVVITSLDQFYSYNINATTQGSVHDPVRTVGDDNLRSTYLGLALGDSVNFYFAPAFAWFAEGVIQGLYSVSKMTVNQTPDQLADPAGVYSDYRDNIRVADTSNTFTYRAQLTTGLNFYPKLRLIPDPLKLAFFIGVDQWGYVPQDMTITAFGASTPHIKGHSMRNFFVGAGATIPIA